MENVFNTIQETSEHFCGTAENNVVNKQHKAARDETEHESDDGVLSGEHSSSSNDNPVARGTRGNAFARVESVQVVSSTSRKPNRVLLHPMTVLFPESKVTAIMGPSGSGKSTLLHFLTGSIQGNLKAKGEVNLEGQMGFVPQHDHLHGFYTCRTYMEHYTRLAGMKVNHENTQFAKELLAGLGMENHADTIVGDMFRKGLSGGQKRRLSVALESLSRPETLFLDGECCDEALDVIYIQSFVLFFCLTCNVSCTFTAHYI
jgi:ABC-type nitrate/sulfonate/bicarbonate transport system ATPase subunit